MLMSAHFMPLQYGLAWDLCLFMKSFRNTWVIKVSLAVTFVALMAAVPVLMGAQNWDDHDRSGRYTARDIGANYLKSCAPNSISVYLWR